MAPLDEQRYLTIQSDAVALEEPLSEAVTASLHAGAANLFFTGAGGAGILMLPAAGLLAARSTFPVYVAEPAELVAVGHAQLGPRSLVVLPSLSGTTPETLRALEHCRERGATVLALTAHDDSPLAAGADQAFIAYAEDDTSSESFYVQSLVIAYAVLRHRGEDDRLADLPDELPRLPGALLELKHAFEPQAAEIAAALAASDPHIIVGAGSTWAEAFYYGMCILEEMQWIWTRPVNAAHFFHGPLELLEEDVSVITLKGEDAARPLVERVERFASTITDRLLVLDAAELPLPGISAQLRPLLSPVLLAAALERVSAELEALRAHPLTTRRYYRRVAY